MIIEAGKYYKASDGSKVGPMVCDRHIMVSKRNDGIWYDDGSTHLMGTLHLIAEWQDEETGTLEELNVKAGDVVECVSYGGDYWTPENRYTITSDCKVPNKFGELFRLDSPAEALFKLISRADPTPTLWRDMTDAEKGALLLAKHNLESIEQWQGYITGWQWVKLPLFNSGYAYRIKPKKGTVSVKNEYGVLTHTSAIDITDGIPDTSTIELEDV